MTVHQQEQPEAIARDCYGVLLVPGLTVAYNKSGDVKRGTILSIDKFYWLKSRDGVKPKSWWSLKCDIKISELGTNQVSSIKNINSIIVI